MKMENNIISPIMEKIYKLCIDEPLLSVKDILNKLEIKQCVYYRLTKNYDSIPKYRFKHLGMSKTISDEHKQKVMKNLKYIKTS